MLFILLALFWGGSFVFIKEVIEVVPSFSAAFYRVFFAFIFLSLIYAKKFKWPKDLKSSELALLIFGSLCSVGIPFSLLFWGEQYITGGMAGVLNGTVPLWTLIIGVAFFPGMVRFTKIKLLGVFVGAIGIICIFYPKLNYSGEGHELWGLLAIIFMSGFYAIGINLNNKIIFLKDKISNETNLILQQFFSMIYLFFVALFFDGVPTFNFFSNLSATAGIFYLSFLSTAIAFMIFMKLIKDIGPVRASSVTFFVPIVALSLDIAINHNVPMNIQLIGTVVILVSLIFIKKD